MTTSTIITCSDCGQPLTAHGECVVCLLRCGLSDRPENLDSLDYGDFEIKRRDDGSLWELGSGAMGVTYRAHDNVLQRPVALKVIEIPESSGDAAAIRTRFLREARAAAALKHPNVAGIFQFSAAPESPFCFYAMELVEGETLQALVRRDGPLAAEPALEVAIQIARALAAAAGQGLIHRDLKPGNIMLTRDFQVKVIDFGLAKRVSDVAQADLTHGNFIGTPAFASPEQFTGAPADARSDIYSLGVTLWYALTGDVPFPGRTIPEIRARQDEVPLPLEQLRQRRVPAILIEILQSVLALDPAQRPASAKDLLGRLETCRARFDRPLRRQKKVLIAVSILALLAGSLFYLQRHSGAADESVAVLPSEDLAATNERTTSDLMAFALYNEAKNLTRWMDLDEGPDKKPRIIELLNQALERDPKFVLAYCFLGELYSRLYARALSAREDGESLDRLAREAIGHAMELRPDLGESHLALALYDFFLNKFELARGEVNVARRLLPNNPEALFLEARIDRRQNRWEDSIAHAHRAYELDPQNGEIINWLCEDYLLLHHFAEGERFAYQAMKGKPELTSSVYANIADMKLAEGDPQAAREISQRLPPTVGIFEKFETALYLRDYDGATEVLATAPAEACERAFGGQPPRTLCNGELARARGDESAARAAFEGAREDWEQHGRRDEFYFSEVAMLDAGLGRKEEAIREAEHAVELVPISGDPLYGPNMVRKLAYVYAWTGESERAIEQLETIAKIPGDLSYGDLRFNPCWDGLRNHPRFDKILASLAPKTPRLGR